MTKVPKNIAPNGHLPWSKIELSQLYHLSPLNHQILCFKAQFEANDPSIRESLLPKLSQVNRGNVLHLKKIQDQNRSIISRILLEQILKHFGCNMNQLETNEYGKPFLNNHAFEFNLSHSGDVVLLAISSQHPIGVDIEKIEIVEDFDSFTPILHPSELSYFQTIKKQKDCFELMKLWTHKEAISKALGLGFQLDINKIALNQNNGIMKINAIPSIFPQEWSLQTLYPSDNYIGAIAVPFPECEISTFTIEISQLN
jgi:4'-phosphopantetheinyl transferase